MPDVPISPTAVESTEAYQTLLARVGRKSPTIPAELLVRHVLDRVPASEWPVRVEAMDALLRRLDAARREGLRIESRPAAGAALGRYATRRKGSGVRPYATVLNAIDPIDGQCNCPDFVKNSLGVCKHLFGVLEHLYSRPRLLQQATKEGASRGPQVGLDWDPIRPLTGEGDWLARVVWHRPAANGSKADRSAQAAKWFRQGDNSALVLRRSYADQPSKRLELVEDLLGLLRKDERAPALRALLSTERGRLRRQVEWAPTPAELRSAIKGLKQTLYPYQRQGVERFLAAGRLLLADDMGLGKTAQAIASIDVLWRLGRVRRGLIIAPASLKPQWAREWARFSGLPIQVVDGSPSERIALYERTKSGLFIINYEQLLRDLETVRRWAPDLVALDEAQRIKNWATKTALSVKGLDPVYRLVLTGTPMENRIDELASIVEWVDDHALEPKWRLGALHAVRTDGRTEITGVRHLDTIRDRLRGCMVRRVRQDVLDQLPPRTDTRVPIEWTGPQQESHDALIQPILVLMQRAKVRPLTQAEFLRLMSLLTTQRIISNGLAQLQFEDVWPSIRSRRPDDGVIAGLNAPKLLELRQLVRQLVVEQGRKVVIFSQWRRMLALAHWAVGDLLASERLRAGFFTGAEGRRRREQNIVEFHDDPSFRLLFASDAGGVGLNLQRAANCVINLELPWNPAVLEQRIGRIYRIGQEQPIDVYNLVCEQGIESRIAGLVGSKQAFFKGLFDGESDAVQFEQSGSFLSRVEKLYDGAAAPASSSASDFELAEVAESEIDDEVSDPFEPLLEAADESRDSTSEPARADNDAVTAPLPAAGDVRELFAKLRVRREPDGGVVIQAPPEAASTLGELLEGLAAMIRAASIPGALPAGAALANQIAPEA